MNNFPAMTEEQRELEIALVKEMRSHVDFWGHASGFDDEFLMRCADAYLAMLTTEPVGEVVSMKATVLDGMADVRTTKVIRNASSIKRLPSGTKLYTAPPAPVLRVPDGWKLVPVEPTEDMLAAAKEWFGLTTTAEGVYEKMLAAAPEASNDQC